MSSIDHYPVIIFCMKTPLLHDLNFIGLLIIDINDHH